MGFRESRSINTTEAAPQAPAKKKKPAPKKKPAAKKTSPKSETKKKEVSSLSPKLTK